MDFKTQLNIFLTLKHMSMKQLAKLLSEKMNKPYTAAMLYGKLNRDTISYTECKNIADILGYNIEFVQK